MSEGASGTVRLVADAMLGRLARWLRLVGYDTLYDPRYGDDELVRLARAEGRILLTRDRALARRRGVRTLFIASQCLQEQLSQVVRDLGLEGERAFSRCSVCNQRLESVPKSWAWGHVPPYTFATQREFRLCPACNRFYWRGTHWDRIRQVLGQTERKEA